MTEIKFKGGELLPEEQQAISTGFERHTASHSAPPFDKKRLNWLAYGPDSILVGALTADLLWDWIYIDELWVAENVRGQGLGKQLMGKAEQYAVLHRLSGIWLWTQSWQAADFYKQLGYEEFTRFADFPKGHARIGLRKPILHCAGD
jgi:GNAT superfamily N-acetyltransferase